MCDFMCSPVRCSRTISLSGWSGLAPSRRLGEGAILGRVLTSGKCSRGRRVIKEGKPPATLERIGATCQLGKAAGTSEHHSADLPVVVPNGMGASTAARSGNSGGNRLISRASPRTVSLGEKRSIAESHPHVAAQWHPTKNGDLTSDDFSAGSEAKVWWLCSVHCSSCAKLHEWQAPIYNRTRKHMPTGCPFCSGHSICPCSSLAATRPDLMVEWDFEGNKGLDPGQIGTYSEKEVFWKCARHGPWVARVNNRSRGTGCPKCANVNRVLNYTKRQLFTDEHPELVAQLHPTKNAHFDLNEVTSGSSIEAVWVCHDRKNAPDACTHSHEWTARITDRTGSESRKGSGCPFCSGLRVCACNSMAAKAPEVAAQWHPMKNGDKRSEQFGEYSKEMIWWQHIDEITGEVHEWEGRINDRVRVWKKQGRLSCPDCFKNKRGRLIG